MDKELLDMLNEARAKGANEQQLQQIVDLYKSKKKSGGSSLDTNQQEPAASSTSRNTNLPSQGFNQSFPTAATGFETPTIKINEGGQERDLPINTRAIPSFYDKDKYVRNLQQKVNTNTLTPEDQDIINKSRKSLVVFGNDDDEELTALVNQYADYAPGYKEGQIDKIQAAEKIKNQLGNIIKGSKMYIPDNINAYNKIYNLLKDYSNVKAVQDPIEIYKDVDVRTDQSGNLAKKAIRRLAAFSGYGAIEPSLIDSEVEHKLESLPEDFS